MLSELLAVAGSRPGPLEDRLAQRIEADLVALPAGRSGGPPGVAGTASERATLADPWYDSELHHAIEAARDEGLAIDISGDRASYARLHADARRALGLAVRQCLVNVLRHSGSPSAEVALSAGGGSVSVMVVDGGSGFPASAPAADRLGLRQSVQDRIARVGGSVDIYSRADIGTTVIMTIPVAPGSAITEGIG